jgi:hypothetical protein
LAVIQSSGSVLLSIVSWKKCVIIGVNSFVSSFNIFGLISSGPRAFISSTRKDTQRIPPLDTKQGTTTESDVDKAEALNDQFTGVFTKKTHDQVPLLERKIPE